MLIPHVALLVIFALHFCIYCCQFICKNVKQINEIGCFRTMLNQKKTLSMQKLHHQCDGQHARLRCGRSWVKTLVESNQCLKISICCFSDKHTALRNTSKDWLVDSGHVQVGQHVYPQSFFSTKHILLEQSRRHHHLIEMRLIITKIQLKNCSLGIKQNHSLNARLKQQK